MNIFFISQNVILKTSSFTAVQIKKGEVNKCFRDEGNMKILILMLLFTVNSYASFKELAKNFYDQKLYLEVQSKNVKHRTPFDLPLSAYCNTEYSQSCVEFVQKKLSSFEYDTLEKLQNLIGSCKGNLDDKCLTVVTAHLSINEYDDHHEMASIARSCRGVDAQCVTFITSKLSLIEKDEREELSEIARSCMGADIKCLKYVCEHAEYGACKYRHRLTEAARHCGLSY